MLLLSIKWCRGLNEVIQGSGWALSPMMSVLRRQRERFETQRLTEKALGARGMTHLKPRYAKPRLQPLEVGKGVRRGFRGTRPSGSFVLNFGPPEL